MLVQGLLGLSLLVSDAVSTPVPSEEVQGISITERLGDQVNIGSLKFQNEVGESVALSTYFTGKKPVILMFVYYRCPGVCTPLLNGFVNSASSLELNPGQDYEIVTVSMNHQETFDLAAEKKATYMKRFNRDVSNGWHWLVGSEDQVSQLAAQLGFGFRYDKESGEFAHAAGIFVLSPTGMISRVLYGVDFPYKDLKLSLLEASDGKIGSIVDRVLMLCYRYDPFARGYSIYALRMVQLAGMLMMVGMIIYLLVFWTRDRKRNLVAR